MLNKKLYIGGNNFDLELKYLLKLYFNWNYLLLFVKNFNYA